MLADYGDRIRVVRHEQNRGFATSCNDGAAIARGRHLVFLNNDTIPLSGWLSRVLEEGRKTRTLRFGGTATDVARALVASLEGAMLVARAYGDASRFDSASAQLVAQLDGSGARR